MDAPTSASSAVWATSRLRSQTYGIRSSQPAYAFDTTNLVGAGWIGPYAPDPFVENLLALDSDPFGNGFVYTSTEFNRNDPGEDGALVAARITSLGADGDTGGGDDLSIDILKAEIFSQVTGTLMRNNQTVPFASVTLNTPVDGAVDQAFAVTDANGDFAFTDVSFGFRSISIDPRLTYEDGTAKLQGTRMKFTVTNFDSDEVSITSITATYTTSPVSYFEQVRFGNSTVWNYNTDNGGTRLGSGETVNFSSTETVDGSGKPIRSSQSVWNRKRRSHRTFKSQV